MSSGEPDPLPALRARLREAQQHLEYLHLAAHNIGFAIAYGAAAEAWSMLDELGRQGDELELEIEGLKAEIARLEAADSAPPAEEG